MPRIILLLLLLSLLTQSLSAQPVPKPKPKDGYQKEWEAVEKKEREGLPKSALKLVAKIYQRAKAERNAPEQVKALIHLAKYTAQVEEEGLVKAILLFEAEAKGALFPVQPVLYSLLADFYWQYYQQNRYRFLNRTATAQILDSDIRTWDLQRLLERVIATHELALSNQTALQKTPLSLYDSILDTAKDSKKYRPTLFDFLAHQALMFYKNEESSLPKPTYEFELTSLDGFKPAKAFARLRFETQDTSSLKYRALRLYQDLIKFHLDDKEPDALIDIDLARLAYVRQITFHEEKDAAFEQALKQLDAQYRHRAASTDVLYELANYYFTLGAAKDKEGLNGRQRALKLCEEALQRAPNSRGAINCRSLKSQILQKQFRLTGEQCVAPNQPFRALAQYQNFNKAYFRIVRLPDTDEWRYAYRTDRLSQALQLNPIREFVQEFPLPNDLLEHSAEFKVDGLPTGHYALLMSARKDFKREANILELFEFWSTSLSLVTISQSSDEDATKTFLVLDAQTGKPIAGATAELFREEYDYKSQRYRTVKIGKYISDKAGKFTVRETKYAFQIDLRYQDDRFTVPDQFYVSRRYDQPEREPYFVALFTDRSLYRPSQTIYFKGILLHHNSNRTKYDVVPNEPVKVTFYDVNYQVVSTLSLRTNEYGTFHGSFAAPTGVLTGRMQIEAKSKGTGRAFVQVEEYKRPKFEVSFKPIQGAYRLGETVKVTGVAKSYAGAAVTDAMVKFRVVRNTAFPMWWRWWIPRPTVPDREIAHGTLTTDAHGEFVLEFPALPDRSIPESDAPEFTYTVYADVTDLSGETRTGQTSVQVGYLALRVSLNLPEMIDKTKPIKASVQTENLSGTFEPAQGTLKLYKIPEPSRPLRERLWQAPDQFTLTKAEYGALFPDDYYADEDRLTSETVGTTPRSFSFNNRAAAELIEIPFASMESGRYLAVVETKDRFGKPIKLERRLTLYSPSDAKPAATLPSFFVIPEARNYEPGETFRFIWGSAYPDVEAYYEIEHQGKIIRSEILKVSNSQKVYDIPIKEEHRGNLSFRIYFVHRYRFYQVQHTIVVPWTNKELRVEWSSFRNKLLPGAEEEWSLKLSGLKGEKVSAEMVAALYDASLDAFLPHSWSLSLYPYFSTQGHVSAGNAFRAVQAESAESNWNRYEQPYYQNYDALKDYGLFFAVSEFGGMGFVGTGRTGLGDARAGGLGSAALRATARNRTRNGVMNGEESTEALMAAPAKQAAATSEVVAIGTETKSAPSAAQKPATDFQSVKVRRNLSETAFFFPTLTTNENGDIIFRFKVPEALTRWKFLGLAHTKDARIGQISAESITQKDVMVQPNPPRFLRENDEIEFPVKITNLSDKDQSGVAMLSLLDATTMKPLPLTGLGEKPFSVKAGSNVALFWRVKIPEGISAMMYRAVAKAGNFSDGEENVLPTLTDKMLVTETLPLPVRAKQTRSFELTKLLQSQSSNTLRHERLTLEFTSNPAWYAVQALPYLMEFPYECAEQLFSRYYANSIASFVANSSPKIRQVFEQWKNAEPSALLSNLEKNEELKQALLEETPWVLDGKSESERKRRIALLFELNLLAQQLKQTEQKLVAMQLPSGGFPWFSGMSESRWVTQHIVAGVGHLDKLGIYKRPKSVQLISALPASLGTAMNRAIEYLDEEMTREYEWIMKHAQKPEDDHLSYLAIHYLYARSYFPDIPIDGGERQLKALDYWKRQAEKYWTTRHVMLKGMLALAFHRFGAPEAKALSKKIMHSIKEYALTSDELGMYWKENTGGYYWHQAPIETQALLIECFDEILDDRASIEAMKTWLLKHKQTHNWRTTKATAEACYALLLRGADLLASDKLAEITLGSLALNPKAMPDVKMEAGTGYFKTAWTKEAVKPEYGKVTVKNPNDVVAWGALYWQYFERMDNITAAETPLKLRKQLFIERSTDKGKVLEPITEKTPIKVGDVVKVRLELRVDRDMEFLHLKDMRAAGFEPLNVISGYKFQDGLGYYESTRDVATHFFMDYVRKGVYVFEYALRATHRGKFQNGVASIQSMYAPEFSSHSEGIIVEIK
ncbi:MAG: alpha-2-macroglobulin family protein [Chloroherpetonaceae bacterium]|nr:alpha-2-macroglobulin family protein [Chloroherpetonaceae bacterium]